MPAMPLYRCYFLDGDDHIRERADIEADTLAIAIDQALELLKKKPQCRSFEIWQGDQRLYRMRSLAPPDVKRERLT